jgi:hypothetical protein
LLALKSSRESKKYYSALLKAVNWNKNCFEDFK